MLFYSYALLICILSCISYGMNTANLLRFWRFVHKTLPVGGLHSTATRTFMLFYIIFLSLYFCLRAFNAASQIYLSPAIWMQKQTTIIITAATTSEAAAASTPQKPHLSQLTELMARQEEIVMKVKRF